MHSCYEFVLDGPLKVTPPRSNFSRSPNTTQSRCFQARIPPHVPGPLTIWTSVPQGENFEPIFSIFRTGQVLNTPLKVVLPRRNVPHSPNTPMESRFALTKSPERAWEPSQSEDFHLPQEFNSFTKGNQSGMTVCGKSLDNTCISVLLSS